MWTLLHSATPQLYTGAAPLSEHTVTSSSSSSILSNNALCIITPSGPIYLNQLAWTMLPRPASRVPFFMQAMEPRMFQCKLLLCNQYVYGWKLFVDTQFFDAVVRGEEQTTRETLVTMHGLLTLLESDMVRAGQQCIPELNSDVLSPDTYVPLPSSWKLPLMESQKQSVAWMHSFESMITAHQNGIELPRWTRIGNTESGWVLGKRLIMPVSLLEALSAELPRRSISYYGGVLADAMGSGKTASMLALIASSPPTPPPLSLLSKRGVSMEDAAHLVPVHASLVIVPLNLSRQWMEEVAKFCPFLKVVRLINKRDHDALTHASVLNCDMVLTTHSFLTGRPYASNLSAAASFTTAMRATYMRMGVHGEEKGVMLSNFFWRRIVFDEHHECSHVSAHIHSLSAAVYWGVTGTPAVNMVGVNNLVWRIPAPDLAVVRTDALHARLVSATFRKTSYTPPLPPIQFRELVVELTQREQEVVRAHDSLVQRIQLGTSLSVLALMNRHAATHEEDEVLVSMSFREVSRLMLAHRASEVESAGVDVRGLETVIANDHALLTTVAEHEGVSLEGEEGEADTNLIRTIKRRIKHNERQLGECRARLASLTQQHAYFKTQLEDVTVRQCPICFSDTADVITQCGHWFCGACIREYLKNRSRAACPVCKAQLVARGWMQVTEEGGAAAASQESNDEELCGTKLQAIIALLRELKARDERVIMFVQWSDLMRAVRAVLVKAGVNAVAVCGNTNTRNMAVSKMQSGEADVLLLSLDTSTSGLNLVQANHVIFAHALVPNGTDSKEDMERQAVARVHRLGQTRPVTVHWCLARNTDEYALHHTRSSSVSASA